MKRWRILVAVALAVALTLLGLVLDSCQDDGGSTPAAASDGKTEAPSSPTPPGFDQFEGPTSTLEIEVRNTLSDRAAVGARVELSVELPQAGGRFQQTLLTDAEGRVAIEVPADAEFHAVARGSAGLVGTEARAGTGATGDRSLCTLQLQPRRSWQQRGVLLDAQDRPVAGARLDVFVPGLDDPFVHDPETRGGEVRAFATESGVSDEEGRFELRLTPTVDQLLRVDAEGYSTRVVPLLREYEGQELQLELRQGSSLDLSLFDAKGDPVEGVELRLSAPVPDLRAGVTMAEAESTRWMQRTSAEGRASFTGLPGAPLSVEWWRGDRLLRRLDEPLLLEAGESLRREWVLGAGVTVRGRLREEDGSPLANQLVQLFPVPAPLGEAERVSPAYLDDPYFQRGATASCRTDEEGGFEFVGVEPGHWWVGPAVADPALREAAPAPLALPVSVLAGDVSMEMDVELELTAYRGRFLAGKLLDPEGQPLRGGLVEFHPLDTFASYAVLAKEDGAFRIGPLAPGSVMLRALDGEMRFSPGGVEEVEVPNEELELRTQIGGTITGRVLDKETGGASTAWVWIESDDPAGEETFAPAKDVPGHNFPGRFERQGLPVGRYHALASTEDGRAGFVTGIELDVGTEAQIEILLEPAGVLAVAAATPTTPLYVVVKSQGDPVHVEYTRGNSSVALPAGDYEVLIADSPEAEARPIELRLEAGARRELSASE